MRRLAWQHAADAVGDLPDVEMETDGETDMRLSALYNSTRNAIVRWMRARGRGVMGPPPGGVGTK